MTNVKIETTVEQSEDDDLMNEMVHEEAKHDNELAVEGKKAFM